ncbi:MAG: hypothetical protein IPM48_15075 [Saprospiraceae bacterium]|nr:hypothetical protein [Saprospiraceae bacterium]
MSHKQNDIALEQDYETLAEHVYDFADKWDNEKTIGALRTIIDEMESQKDKDVRRSVADTCLDCGRRLPDAVLENRDNGYAEFVTYCPCGATYIS